MPMLSTGSSLSFRWLPGPRRDSGVRAIGLVEALVALAVLMIAMGGVFVAFNRSSGWSKEVRLASAADQRLREAVESLAASPAPRQAGGPDAWAPGRRVQTGIPLQPTAGEPPLANAALTTEVSDIEREHQGRVLRFRSARLELAYQYRGRTHVQRREYLRGFDP